MEQERFFLRVSGNSHTAFYISFNFLVFDTPSFCRNFWFLPSRDYGEFMELQEMHQSCNNKSNKGKGIRYRTWLILQTNQHTTSCTRLISSISLLLNAATWNIKTSQQLIFRFCLDQNPSRNGKEESRFYMYLQSTQTNFIGPPYKSWIFSFRAMFNY